MKKEIKITIEGSFACFTRPECKVEKMSYEVITPSAARNILQAIYWKPEFQWRIKEIHVLNPIRFIAMTLNELGTKKQVHEITSKIREQTRNLFLKDVKYGIIAEIIPNSDTTEEKIKHYEIFNRRASKGQCFTTPYLGLREFIAEWDLIEKIPKTKLPDELATKPLGPMILDFNYIPDPKGNVLSKRTVHGVMQKVRIEPIYFDAVMHQGIIQIPNPTL